MVSARNIQHGQYSYGVRGMCVVGACECDAICNHPMNDERSSVVNDIDIMSAHGFAPWHLLFMAVYVQLKLIYILADYGST